MTDFDKLIKEKVEQAEYAYKPSAWRSFRRVSGIGHGSPLFWAAGISFTLLVGGAIAFAFLRQPQASSDLEPVSSSLQVVDTACVEEQSAFSADTLLVTSAPEEECSAPSASQGWRSVRESDSEEKSAKSQSVAPPAEPNAPTRRYRRPLVIDVDTIKDNVPTDEELRNGNSRLF